MQIISAMSNEMLEMNATEAHVQLENVEKKEGLTAVISVYDNQKPANMVLSELYAWAEKNNEEVKDLIEKLEQDMTWNKGI